MNRYNFGVIGNCSYLAYIDTSANINWVKSTSIPYIYQDEVIRSALVLKPHQYEDTGAVIASGSTSLPEIDQRHRNWDYRYCWMKDTYYTLNALNNSCENI
jgi:GH15 family glucan-1,4-alpha-glucosidase